MPLWSNEEWKARIGSSWCAMGQPIKCGRRTRSMNDALSFIRVDFIVIILKYVTLTKDIRNHRCGQRKTQGKLYQYKG